MPILRFFAGGNHSDSCKRIPTSFDGSVFNAFTRSSTVRILLSMASLPDALSVTIVIPFAPFMVQELLNIPPDASYRLGYYCGLIACCFACGSIFGSPVWGRLADKIGRRPVILCGLSTNSFFLFLFGLSPSYPIAIFLRFLHGMLTGNVTVSKTYLSDITDSTNESAAFGMIGMTFGLGVVTGPIIGGYLSRPAIQYPGLVSSTSFFGRHPYALPCMTVGALSTISLVLSLLLLPESKTSEPPGFEEDSPEYIMMEESNYKRKLAVNETVSVPIHIYGTFPSSVEGTPVEDTAGMSVETSTSQTSHRDQALMELEEHPRNTDFDSSVYVTGSHNLKEVFFLREYPGEKETASRSVETPSLLKGRQDIYSAVFREQTLETDKKNERKHIIPTRSLPVDREREERLRNFLKRRRKQEREFVLYNSPAASAVSDISGYAAIAAFSSFREQGLWNQCKHPPRNSKHSLEELPVENLNKAGSKESMQTNKKNLEREPLQKDAYMEPEPTPEMTIGALATHLFFSNECFSVVLRVALSISFVLNSMDEVLSLWAVNDTKLGGVCFSTADLGIIQTMGGVSCIFSAVVIFQKVAARIGVLNTMRLGLIVGLVFYPVPAYVSALQLRRTDHLTWIFLIFGNIMTSFCGQCCHTAIPLLVKNAAPPSNIGQALGYAQGLQSVGFAAGPLVGSCLFALIVGAQGLPSPLNKGRLYYMLGDIAIFFILRATYNLPPWPWKTSPTSELDEGAAE
eukprot:jgi/Galph1/3680/GphlegSOOS_G2324.1